MKDRQYYPNKKPLSPSKITRAVWPLVWGSGLSAIQTRVFQALRDLPLALGFSAGEGASAAASAPTSSNSASTAAASPGSASGLTFFKTSLKRAALRRSTFGGGACSWR